MYDDTSKIQQKTIIAVCFLKDIGISTVRGRSLSFFKQNSLENWFNIDQLINLWDIPSL